MNFSRWPVTASIVEMTHAPACAAARTAVALSVAVPRAPPRAAEPRRRGRLRCKRGLRCKRRRWRLLRQSLGVAMLEKFRESFRFVGAEPDHSTWLPPRLLERVPHVADHWLGWRVGQTLERSPSLPCRFQARSCVLRARDLLWI